MLTLDARARSEASESSAARMPPYLLPWIRVPFLIRSITSTTWGHEAWPKVKPLTRRALEMRRQIARDGWWN